VILGRAFGRFPCLVPAVVDGFAVVVLFLDPVLLLCANTSELTAAVKSVTPATTIIAYISTFLLTSFEFVVVVITIQMTELLL
jgi:hypothetical protein